MTRARLRIVGCLLIASAGLAAEVAAQSPNDGREALIGLARVRRDAGDPEGARVFFERASGILSLSPGEQAEYFWVLTDARPAEAVALARRLLRAAPAEDQIRDRAIAAAVTIRDEAAVTELATAGRQRSSNDARWPRHLAESALRRNRPAEAARLYAAALAARGAEDRDRVGLALAREAAGDAPGAMAAWSAVGESVRVSEAAWTASFLRALAGTAAPAVAAAAFEPWVRRWPGDVAMREMLVELWARAGQPARALAALEPLTLRPLTREAAVQRWTRREVDLALAAADPARAIRALDRLDAAHVTTRTDRVRHVALLIDSGDVGRAVDRLGTWPCGPDLFAQAERLPEPAGTHVMFDAVRRASGSCGSDDRLTRRTLDRLVAEGRHGDAISVLALLPAETRGQRDLRRLSGQLALWTGHASDAVVWLEPLRRETPEDRAAADALVDAYRGVGRAYDAWDVASDLAGANRWSDARILVFAEVALEADAPREAEALLDRLAPGADIGRARHVLRARAALALGRPGDARRMLAEVPVTDLPAQGALALIDSTLAVQGRLAALTVARQVARDDVAWKDVFARRVMLELLVDPASASSLRAQLAALDSALTLVVDIEVALAREDADQALALLDSAAIDTDRLADLRATAQGATPRSAEILSRLRTTRPGFTPFEIREADLAWQLNRTDEAFDRLAAIHASMPDHQPAAVALARALAARGRHRDAVDLIARIAPEADRTLAAHTVLAASLQALAAAEVPPVALQVDDLARARVLASSARWADALTAIEGLVARDAGHRDALRFRADVLSWAGAHEAAIAAFDEYIAVAPLDLDARRQQARVAGWSGAFADAKRRYRAVAAAWPDHAALAAEAAAKSAFFDGRWRLAAGLYRAWLALEPDNAEARFELAEAEQAAGNPAAAEAERLSLEARAEGHATAREARDRAALRARASATLATELRAANGYEGRRLLDVAATGARIEQTWGAGGRVQLAAEGARLSAVAARERLGGARAGVAAAWRLDRLVIDGAVSRSAYDGAARDVTEGLARLTWQADDRWSASAGVSRHTLAESLASVSGGLAQSGPFATIAFASPTASVDLHVMSQGLSDGNARRRATVFATRTVAERWRGLRMVGWAEYLGYREASPVYYAPGNAVHIDAGAEYTQAFSRARFRGDRERSVTAGYLVGVNSRGSVFHQPTARWSIEVVPGLVLDGHLSRVQSSDYRETRFTVGLRVGGNGRFASWRD